MDEREIAAAMTVVAGRELLARAADALSVVGVVPVALKGVVLSALSEGSGAPPRPMSDVDILVRPRDRRVAERALAAAGLEEIARSPVATTLRARDLRLDLDLHTALVEPELFRLDTDDLVERAADASSLFGRPVRMLERHDFYAHLVAHFARNRSNAHDRRHLRDFAVVARALPMRPDDVASHLLERGLARAARYALTLASRRGDEFAAHVLSRLPRDRVGALVARSAELWLATHAGNAPLAVPALHALNRSLPAGMRSLGAHLARGLASRARRVLERAPEAR
ncbi:hypothetical protein DB32_004123 [Sandaracinus amylolyticus]|uniref:Uncharacterized protein n=2 Tax=Sandaracinus amylolyticus TaxID=927083 RepID=A0A0F6SFH9_9BACT|nr:hypothetical protein DB32_004123 [Sandaracinus amylolyticus]